MKALQYLGNNKFKVSDIDRPEPHNHDVLVQIKVAALCGSDLHIKEQHDQKFKTIKGYKPKITSHEPAGIVSQVGSEVTKVHVGQRVAVYHKIGCMKCKECLEGNIVMCPNGGALSSEYDGAAADYLLVPQENCLPLEDELSFEDGAIMMCAGGTAFSGLKKIRVVKGESVAIFGCGPVGLATLLFAKAMGSTVIAVDIHPSRLKRAKTLGADTILLSTKGEPINEVYDLIHGYKVPASPIVTQIMDLTAGKGVDCVVECSGSKQARIDGVDALAKHGRMVLLGINSNFYDNYNFSFDIEPEKMIYKELSLFGSNVFPLPLYYEMASFMVSHTLSLTSMITHRFSLEEGEQAFAAASDADSGKVIFSWE